MSEYKNTYPVEVEYLDGTKETIEFPRISSGAFFDVFTDPEVLGALSTSPDAATLIMVRKLVDRMSPGLLDKLTMTSGFTLLNEVANKEAGNFNLGETQALLKGKKSGKSKTKKG